MTSPQEREDTGADAAAILAQWARRNPGAVSSEAVDELIEIARTAASRPPAQAEVFINPMKLSDGRTDYFVCLRAGKRTLEIHKLSREYQAEYTAAELDWLLHGSEKPDLMAYSEEGWPARAPRPPAQGAEWDEAIEAADELYCATVEKDCTQYQRACLEEYAVKRRALTRPIQQSADKIVQTFDGFTVRTDASGRVREVLGGPAKPYTGPIQQSAGETAPAPEGGETFETISRWSLETFGPATLDRIATRAAEEMNELLLKPTKIEEAADVVIVLSRYPDLWKAVEQKMAINRSRKWRLMGDGSGYHVPSPSAALSGEEKGRASPQQPAPAQMTDGWQPIESAQNDEIVLVANPEKGTLPVVAWKVEQNWYPYDLSKFKKLSPQPTLWMRWPRFPACSASPDHIAEANNMAPPPRHR